jgi:hypothetical protein
VAQNQQANTHFCLKRGTRIMNEVQVFLYIGESYQQLKGLEFISDRMLCIILKGGWCDVIVLTVHAPTEDKL